MEGSDHADAERALSVENFRDPVFSRKESFEVLLAKSFLFHAEFDGLDRIGDADRELLFLVPFDNEGPEFQFFLFGGSRLGVHEGFHAGERSRVFLFGLDDFWFHESDLNGDGINSFVLGVGADEADEDDAGVVVDLHDEAVGVALDVENNPVAGKDVSGWVAGLDVAGSIPPGFDGFVEPCLQWDFGLGMVFIKIAKGFAGNDSHWQDRILWRKRKKKVPTMGTILDGAA